MRATHARWRGREEGEEIVMREWMRASTLPSDSARYQANSGGAFATGVYVYKHQAWIHTP